MNRTSAHQAIGAGLSEIRRNRRLQFGLAVVVLIIVVSLALDWFDRFGAKESELRRMREEVASLRSKSTNENEMRQRLDQLGVIRESVGSRLWQVSSEPVGQAKLKDWLITLTASSGGKLQNLVLSTPREPSKASGVKATGMARSAVVAQPNSGTDRDVRGMREFRANLTVAFSPQVLERLLAGIEGGDALAAVESLKVIRRDRRIELSVRVLMVVSGTPGDETRPFPNENDKEAPSKVPPASGVGSGARGAIGMNFLPGRTVGAGA